MTRYHGCQRPFNFFQVLSWLCSALQLGYVYSVATPYLYATEFWLAPVAFAGLFGCILVVALRVTLANPTDPKLVALSKPQPLNYGMQGTSICEVCKKPLSSLTKHCPTCGRCVWQYYSHSKLVNNCIGWNNYSSYRALLGLIAVSQLTLAYFSCKLLVQSYIKEQETRETSLAIYGDDLTGTMRIFHTVSLCTTSTISVVSSVCFSRVCRDTCKRLRNSPKSFVELADNASHTDNRSEARSVHRREPEESSPSRLDVSGTSEVTFRT